MDFRQHVVFGRTGLTVSRIGLASGYGVPTSAIEKAFHEYGVNYLWLSLLLPLHMVRAIRNLAPRFRDQLRIVIAWPTFATALLQGSVERFLGDLAIEQADLLVIQGVSKPPSHELVERLHRIKDSGRVRFVGMSSHDRPFYGRVMRGEVKLPVDFFHVRYNAVHPGAETDVFPLLPSEHRPGIAVYTATCWGKLVRPGAVPAGDRPLSPADCYRFVLSHPDVNVCVTAPSTAAQMEANLEALDAGPLDEDEMARMRRLGQRLRPRPKTRRG